ncbi:hypothetical protein [Phytohabitans suffuscus]
MRRRSLAALLTIATVATTAVAGWPGAASAARDRAAASANSHWLAAQLSAEGTLENPLGGVLPDHGLMIDTLYAMHASGDGDLATPITSYLDEGGHASDYFTWDGLVPGMGFDAIIVGGATAKVLLAAEVAGRDPRDFDGYDMVAETKGTIMRAGPDKGRVSDYSKDPAFADFVSNNANMFGQSLAVIALAAVGQSDQMAIDTLLTQQCAEGYFRIFFGYIPTTETGDHVTSNGYKVSSCEEGKPFDQSAPDGDATGMALSALVAARRSGVTGLDAPIARTVAWLKQRQSAGGGWGGGVNTEAPNTNSTGLIVQALADAGGADTAVERGMAYIKSAQATAAADSGNALAEELGAIAYNPEQYQAAKTDGIVGRDTWIRASAQASLALSQVGFYDLARGNLPVDPTPGSEPTATPRSPAPSPTQSANPTPTTTATRAAPSPTATVDGAAAAQRLGAYLAGKLVGGDHIEVRQDGKTYVDYDATADLVLALHTLGIQPQAATRAARFLLREQSVKAYAHGAPYETGEAAYAEPLAKLIVIAGFTRTAAGDLHNSLAALSTPDGEFVDTGQTPDTDRSVERHAWTILATLAGPEPDRATRSIEALINQQCADGTFPASLASTGCSTGDLAATAAAVTALNAQPRAATGTAVPDRWSPRRAKALADAATALANRVNGNGVVTGAGGRTDVAVSAATAAGRQAAGLDASDTARALAALVRKDGGLAKPGGTTSDLATSIAAAAGVAGRAWTSVTGAPVSRAVRLPVLTGVAAVNQATTSPAPTVARPVSASGGWPRWLIAGLVALSVLLAVVLALGLRRFLHRNQKAKAVAR